MNNTRFDVINTSPPLHYSSKAHPHIECHQQPDEDKKAMKSPSRSKAVKHSASTAAGDGGGEVAMTTAGRSTPFWRDWHTLKVVKRPRVFSGRGSKGRNSAIEQKPLL